MPTLAKRLLLALAATVAGVALLLIAAVTLVDLNRFKPVIEARVSALTGRELRIAGDIGWSLYPVLGAELRAVTLGNAPGFAGPMAEVERAALGVAVLPLLRGQLQVSEVVLEQPRIALGIDANGRNNWDDLLTALEQDAPPPPSDDTPGGADEPSMDIAIDGVRVSGGEVTWSDERTGQRVQLSRLALRTGALGGADAVPVELALNLESTAPALTIDDLQATAEVSTTDDFASVQWRDLDLSLQIAGAALPTGPVALQLAGGGQLDLNRQQLTLPDLSLNATVGEAATDPVVGPLQLSLKGDLGVALAQLAVDLSSLTLQAQLAPGQSGFPASTVDLALEATAGTLNLDRQTLSLPNVALTSGDLDLTMAIEGTEIVDAPAFRGRLAIAPVALRPLLARFGIEPPATADPGALSQLAFATQFTATPSSFDLRGLEARLDTTTLTGRVGGQLGDVTRLEFAVVLDTIDLDRYLPPSAPSAAPPPPAPGKTPAPGSPPPADDPFGWMDDLAVAGTLQAGQLTVTELTLRDLTATIALKDRVLTADPVRARLYGGEQSVALRLDARSAEPVTQLNLDLRSVAIGDLLGDIMAKAPLSGTAAVKADLQLRGLDADRIKQTLTGSGALSVRDGAIAGVNVAQELRNAVALVRGQRPLQATPATDFTEMALQFTADQGVISWPALTAQSPLLRLVSSGRVDLGRDTLSARIDANVVKSLKGQGGEPLSELAGFNVPLELRGTLSDPKLRVDVRDVLAQTRLGGKLEETETELKEKVEERKEELRGKAAEELQRGLNRLLRPRE